MKNKSILYNLSILVTAGLLVKLLGMLNKIIITRILGVDGVSMYSLMMPTVMLLLGICSFSLSTSIQNIVSTNISKKSYSNRDLIKKCFIISTLLCCIISLITLIFNYSICHYLLKMDELQIPFLCFIPMYFFSSWGGVLKGYYHGHNKLNIYAFAQTLEQIIRILFSLFLIIYQEHFSLQTCLILIVLSMSVGEIFQFGFLFIYTIFFTKIKNETNIIYKYSDFMKTSTTLTISRLITSIAFFLEPIIFTYAFTLTGMSSTIANRYFGILHGYVIPLVITGSFITGAINQAILPSLTSNKTNIEKTKDIISKSLFLSLIPGVLFFFLTFFYSNEVLTFVYGTNIGSIYLKLLGISAFISYFDGVFYAVLLAHNQEKKMLLHNIISSFIKLLLMFTFVQIPLLNAIGLPLSYAIVSVIGSIYGYYKLIKITNYKIKVKSLLQSIALISLVLVYGFISYNKIPFILVIPFICIITGAICLIYYKTTFKAE